MVNQKETELIKKIVACEEMDDTMEGLIDDFVKHYDSDKWCRGWFKTQISQLVFEAKKLTHSKKQTHGDKHE